MQLKGPEKKNKKKRQCGMCEEGGEEKGNITEFAEESVHWYGK